ncbi:hypothetical protein SEPCBS57363_000228 [Sporothrix epigloea]|uniref:Glycosyltransferase family 31 protein n=1 Tax=Sporothrix epigloea TaxID=1892477 RepID=A0ABP0D4K4_9PEZI
MTGAVTSNVLSFGTWITAVILRAFRCIDWLDSRMLFKLGPKYRPVRRILDSILTEIWNAAAIFLTRLASHLPDSFVADYSRRTKCHWSRIRKVQFMLQSRRIHHGNVSEGWQPALLAPVGCNHTYNPASSYSFFTTSTRNHMSSLENVSLQDISTDSTSRNAAATAANYLYQSFLRATYFIVLVLSGFFYFAKLIVFRSLRRVRYLVFLLTLISICLIMFRKHEGAQKVVSITIGSHTTTGTAAEDDTFTKSASSAFNESAVSAETVSDANGVAAASHKQVPEEPIDISFNDNDLTDWVNFLVDKHHLGSNLKYQAVQFAPLFDAQTLNDKARYPTADHPIDDLTPSLNVMDQNLVARHFGFRPSNRGFQDIHMPGRAAIKTDERYAKLQSLNDYGEVDRKGYTGKTKTEIRLMIEIEERIRSEIADTEKVAQKIAQAIARAKFDADNDHVGDGDEATAWFDGLRVYRYKNDRLQAYSLPFLVEAVEGFSSSVSEEDRQLFSELNNEIQDPEPEEKPEKDSSPESSDMPAQIPTDVPAEALVEPIAPVVDISETENYAAALAAAVKSISEIQKTQDKMSEDIKAALKGLGGIVEEARVPVKRQDAAFGPTPVTASVGGDLLKYGKRDDIDGDDIDGSDINNQIQALFAELESYIDTAETSQKSDIAVPISHDTTGSKALDKIIAQGASNKLTNDGIVVTLGDSSLITITTNSTAVAVTNGDAKFVIAEGGHPLINETPKMVDAKNFFPAPEPVNDSTDQFIEKTLKKQTGGRQNVFEKSPVKPVAVLPTVAASMSHLELPRAVIHVPVSGRGFVQNIEPSAEPLWTEIAGGMKSKNGNPFLRSQYKRVPERKKGEPPLLPEVPKGSSVDASGLMVGISTTYSRLHNNDFAAIDDWARWLTDGKGQSNGAFLYLVLHRPRNNETKTVRDLLIERGIFFDIIEDWGHEEEGVGGGPLDVHPLPVVPDADSIRYANLLDWMRQYCHSNFGEGRPNVLHEAIIKDSDDRVHKKDKKLLQPDKWEMLVYALLDDDIFVPGMGRLVAKLQEHRGLHTDYDPRVGRSSIEKDLDTEMWLGFPSDPWSDWTFHNGTTLHEQFMWEHATYGNATTTKVLDDRFINPDVATFLPSAYGGGAMFMFVDLAHQMADLACMRRSKGDNIINTVFKANRAAFYRGEHLEASWDEQLYRCTIQSIPEVRLRLIPSYYAPSDAAVYGTEWESASTIHNTFGKHLARLTQYNGGTHPMVMHNHRTWHNFDVGAAHQVADVCGKDGFLQRFAFADGWVLTNGHSLTRYDELHTVKLEYHNGFEGSDFADLGDPQEMKTPSMLERYRVHQEQRQYYDLLHMVIEYPTRPRDAQALDWTGQQQTYRLIETSVAEDGTILQAYLRPAASPLRDLSAIGGKKYFEDAQGRMAVPNEALAGLDGSAADWATEAPAPDKDELFVVVWQPPGDDASKLQTSGNALAGPTELQRGQGISLESLGGQNAASSLDDTRQFRQLSCGALGDPTYPAADACG